MKRQFLIFIFSCFFIGSCVEEQTNPLVNGATCTDGVQNQDEEGVDCGGICISCQDPGKPVEVVVPCEASLIDNLLTLDEWYDLALSNTDYYCTEESDFFEISVWKDNMEFTIEIYETTLPEVDTKYQLVPWWDAEPGNASIRLNNFYMYNANAGDLYLSYSNGEWMVEVCSAELVGSEHIYELSGRIRCNW
jgi:hypothetical protein